MNRSDPGPLENFSMWASCQPGAHQHASVRNLKRLVNDWVTMATQKTAGQRRDSKGIPWIKKSKAVSWENLERIKMGILCEAVMLVLSGRLDTLEADEPDL